MTAVSTYAVRRQLRHLSQNIGPNWLLVFISKKLQQEYKPKKPSRQLSISNASFIILYVMCDAGYVGYTQLHTFFNVLACCAQKFGNRQTLPTFGWESDSKKVPRQIWLFRVWNALHQEIQLSQIWMSKRTPSARNYLFNLCNCFHRLLFFLVEPTFYAVSDLIMMLW